MQNPTSRSLNPARPAWALLVATLVAVAALAVATPPALAAAPSSEGAAAEGVVNINTADANQLMLLPGIGPSLAQRVVEYRTERRFKRSVELARVKGIGLKTVRKLKPWIRVQGRTTLTKRPRPQARHGADALLRRLAQAR